MKVYFGLVDATNDWYSQFFTFMITTGAVYVAEMLIFTAGLLFYHYFVFLPRVRKKLYKTPVVEASKSLMRIAGMLSKEGGVDKTQEESTDDIDRMDDKTQREHGSERPLFEDLDYERRKKKRRDDLMTATSSVVDKTRSSATTPPGGPFAPPPSTRTARRKKKNLSTETTQESLRAPCDLESTPYIVRSLRFSSKSERETPDNPPNSAALY
ncbi:unnamed protein product [Cylicocyclus nassatus]|uniref:Uncharacterized protein n=1 Tax=Cylicocyclus nassatus TaxID=53992 RepID=A0AA36H8R5_CYLNA|nr:unnamed protein product [Cylicocyclus nassatus]